MAAEDLSDLDFTKVAGLAPAVRREAARPDVVRQGAAIGIGRGGNFISYARIAPQPVASEAHVLVVEDDEITRRLLERVLTLQGFAVRTAADGQEVAQALRQRPLPRLILLDVELPRVSGFRLLGLLRQHPQTSAIPVVMLTGSTDNKDLMQGLSLGADGYLSKPVTIEALRGVIDKVLGTWKP